MKNSLPILTACWLGLAVGGSARVLGQAATEPPVRVATNAAASSNVAPTAASSAPALVHEAAERLDRHTAISARIRQQAHLFGESLLGTGTYQQGPSGSHLLRLELKLQVGTGTTSLQQVADGKYLWIHRQVDEKSTLARVDIRQVLKAREAAAGGTRPGYVLGLGGLPRLLRNLDRDVEFAEVLPTQLAGLPVYAVRGSWSRKALAMLWPDKAAELAAGESLDLRELPEQVPDHIVLYLGRDDLFPYRVEYRRAHEGWSDRLRGAEVPAQTLLVWQLFEVKFNVPVDPRSFVFEAGHMPLSDETEAYLKK